MRAKYCEMDVYMNTYIYIYVCLLFKIFQLYPIRLSGLSYDTYEIFGFGSDSCEYSGNVFGASPGAAR